MEKETGEGNSNLCSLTIERVKPLEGNIILSANSCSPQNQHFEGNWQVRRGLWHSIDLRGESREGRRVVGLDIDNWRKNEYEQRMGVDSPVFVGEISYMDKGDPSGHKRHALFTSCFGTVLDLMGSHLDYSPLPTSVLPLDNNIFFLLLFLFSIVLFILFQFHLQICPNKKKVICNDKFI